MNEEVTVTLTLQKDLGLFGKLRSFPVTIRARASGKVRCIGNEKMLSEFQETSDRAEGSMAPAAVAAAIAMLLSSLEFPNTCALSSRQPGLRMPWNLPWFPW